MSGSVTLEPSSLPAKATTKPAARIGPGARFMATLERLVAAQARRVEETRLPLFAYPPI